MSDQIPALQGRLDLILAEPDRKSGKGGILWANESAWLSKSPAEGAASAKALATKLRDQIESHSLDAKIVAEIERHKNDPFFAMAFAKEISPRELKALISRAYGSDLPPSERPLQHDVATQERLVTMLSTILGTASRGVGRLKLADDYADQLVDHIEDPQNAFAVRHVFVVELPDQRERRQGHLTGRPQPLGYGVGRAVRPHDRRVSSSWRT